MKSLFSFLFFAFLLRVILPVNGALLRQLAKTTFRTTSLRVVLCYAAQDWPEITDMLLPGQTAFDQAPLCARVFKLKLDAMIKVSNYIMCSDCIMRSS